MPPLDISIGPDQWLTWVEPSHTQALNIDELVDYTQPLWQLLETECVAGCCGLEAFNFWADQVAQLPLSTSERVDLSQRLTQVVGKLQQDAHQSLRSYRLNSYMDKAVFIRLLEHLRASL